MNYKKITFSDFDKIQQILVPYVLDKIIGARSLDELYVYNFVEDYELEQMKIDLPEFFTSIKEKLDSNIDYMAFVYADHNRKLPIHIDSDDASVKMRIRFNWPIINANSAETVFYTSNVKPEVKYLPNGSGAFVFNESEVTESDSYLLDKPTLMDVKKIHSIRVIEENFPRIILSMRLSNEQDVINRWFV